MCQCDVEGGEELDDDEVSTMTHTTSVQSRVHCILCMCVHCPDVNTVCSHIQHVIPRT